MGEYNNTYIEGKTDEEVEEVETYYVDVKGEVNKPGVYEMKNTNRVQDVINIAGGFTSQADKNSVNLAEKLSDEMVIYVAKLGESTSPLQGHNEDSKGTLVNINIASKEELDSLPGIGPAKADAIITYREESGNFKTIDDLEKVPGIGTKSLDSLREYITVQ